MASWSALLARRDETLKIALEFTPADDYNSSSSSSMFPSLSDEDSTGCGDLTASCSYAFTPTVESHSAITSNLQARADAVRLPLYTNSVEVALVVIQDNNKTQQSMMQQNNNARLQGSLRRSASEVHIANGNDIATSNLDNRGGEASSSSSAAAGVAASATNHTPAMHRSATHAHMSDGDKLQWLRETIRFATGASWEQQSQGGGSQDDGALSSAYSAAGEPYVRLTLNIVSVPPHLTSISTSADTATPSHNAIRTLTQALDTFCCTHVRTLQLHDGTSSLLQPLLNHSPPRLTRLSLRNCGLNALPDVICTLTQMQILDVSYNKIQSVPANIAHLTKLRELHLNNNVLNTLAASLRFCCDNLETLALHNNKLVAPSVDFRKAQRLQKLFMHGNPSLEYLMELSPCVRLRELSLGSVSVRAQRVCPRTGKALVVNVSPSPDHQLSGTVQQAGRALLGGASAAFGGGGGIGQAQPYFLSFLALIFRRSSCSHPLIAGAVEALSREKSSRDVLLRDAGSMQQLKLMCLSEDAIVVRHACATLGHLAAERAVARRLVKEGDIVRTVLSLLVDGITPSARARQQQQDGGGGAGGGEQPQSPLQQSSPKRGSTPSGSPKAASPVQQTSSLSSMSGEADTLEKRVHALRMLRALAYRVDESASEAMCSEVLVQILMDLVEDATIFSGSGAIFMPRHRHHLLRDTVRCVALEVLGNLAFTEANRRRLVVRAGLMPLLQLVASEQRDASSSPPTSHLNTSAARCAMRTIAILGANDSLTRATRRPPPPSRGVRILSMDGGGMRGLLSVRILFALQKRTGQKLSDMFDLICGTSTGAILAAAMAIKGYSLEECENIYKRLGKEVFTASRPANQANSAAAGKASAAASNADAETLAEEERAAAAAAAGERDVSDPGDEGAVVASGGGWRDTIGSVYRSSTRSLRVVVSGCKHDAAAFESLLQRICANPEGELGVEQPMIESACDGAPKVFVVSTLTSVTPAQVFLFRNYNFPESADVDAGDFTPDAEGSPERTIPNPAMGNEAKAEAEAEVEVEAEEGAVAAAETPRNTTSAFRAFENLFTRLSPPASPIHPKTGAVRSQESEAAESTTVKDPPQRHRQRVGRTSRGGGNAMSRQPHLGSSQHPLWQAIRASSAAPYYLVDFAHDEHRWQDGACIANNPAAIAIDEARRLWPDLPLACLVSIGSGTTPAVGRGKQSGHGLIDVGNVLLEVACDVNRVDETLTSLAPLVPGFVYKRFSPCDARCGMELDSVDPKQWEAIEACADEYVALPDVSDSMDELADVLQELDSLARREFGVGDVSSESRAVANDGEFSFSFPSATPVANTRVHLGLGRGVLMACSRRDSSDVAHVGDVARRIGERMRVLDLATCGGGSDDDSTSRRLAALVRVAEERGARMAKADEVGILHLALSAIPGGVALAHRPGVSSVAEPSADADHLLSRACAWMRACAASSGDPPPIVPPSLGTMLATHASCFEADGVRYELMATHTQRFGSGELVASHVFRTHVGDPSAVLDATAAHGIRQVFRGRIVVFPYGVSDELVDDLLRVCGAKAVMRRKTFEEIDEGMLSDFFGVLYDVVCEEEGRRSFADALCEAERDVPKLTGRFEIIAL